MSLPDLLPIQPFTRPVRGTVTLPGSKSITNRALLLAALCDGPVTLTGALFSEDTEIMAEALRQLGFVVKEDVEQKTIYVEGRAGKIPAENATLHVGLAGTAARFLTALCAAAPKGTYKIDGVAQMRKRPMKGLFDALEKQGAKINYLGETGFFPIEIHAHGLRGGSVEIDASESSQMLSALLMVSPLAKETTDIHLTNSVRWPFVQMTTNLMSRFAQPNIGHLSEHSFRVQNQTAYSAEGGIFPIDPDATAASYFAALPIVSRGKLLLHGLHQGLQGDTDFLGICEKVGLSVEETNAGFEASFCGTQKPTGHTQDFSEFSDTFLTLAAIAPLLDGPTKITGIAHTRKQETDRVKGMANELKKLGQHVIETEDSLEIHPKPLTPGVTIETYGDHRFAMSFAILGCYDLLGNGQPWLTIKNPDCCKKTFPNFFDVLNQLRQEAHFPIVAIDGGAASGKSSTSRAIAECFNLLHVDTGSFYRAVTAELLARGIATTDQSAVKNALGQITLGTRVTGRSAFMEIGGQTIPEARIRSAEVTAAVSHFAAIPELRAALLAYQRGQTDVARKNDFCGLVMEGRDIGSVIFPDADFRFFLHADPAERARRREQQGQPDQIAERDRLDSQRKTAPLVLPPGATGIDSTYLTLEQVVEKLSATIATRLSRA